MYRDGQGGAPDYAKALVLYRQAAQSGNAGAAHGLGTMYLEGRGVAKDPAKARMWFEKAAAQGSAWSQVQLAAMYRDGLGGRSTTRRWRFISRLSKAEMSMPPLVSATCIAMGAA
jgi:uncharacterized protein